MFAAAGLDRLNTPSLRALLALPGDTSPEEILLQSVEALGERLVVATSLGPQSLVILDLLHKMGRAVATILLDTGYLFPETLAHKATIEARYGITIAAISPPEDAPEELFLTDPDACCAARKVEPLRRALAPYDAWVTGIRRDHAASREEARPVEWDAQYQKLKINPLIAWKRPQVDAYLDAHGVPANPLLKDGFTSVGCWPCTSRNLDLTNERAGRWSGRAKTECGIHLRPRST